MKRTLFLLAILLTLVAPAAAAQTSTDCGTLPHILEANDHGIPLHDIDVYSSADPATQVTYKKLEKGDMFIAISTDEDPIVCVNGVRWMYIISEKITIGYIPETTDGQPNVVPYRFTPEAPIHYDVPLVQPVITNPDTPLPTVTPAANPTTLDGAFAHWDWSQMAASNYVNAPDPLALQLPAKYAGDFPTPPVDLSSVYFVKDANLNAAQLALLSQNGFVVVPSQDQQFDDLYSDGNNVWDYTTGKAGFITTDALLHTFFLGYQNTLMALESEQFYGNVADFLMKGYQAAQDQYNQAKGTPLEAAARKAALYYAVPLMLIAPGDHDFLRPDMSSVFDDGAYPTDLIAKADPSIIAEAQPLVDLALEGQGQADVSILENYIEDFSQYKPRSYYAGNPVLEAYFRAMMWLGRITFENKSAADTQTGLLVLRALQSDPTAYTSWQKVADIIDFMVGPVDDYGPKQYAPLVSDLSLDFIGNAANITAFQAQVAQLPPPKVNSIPIPAGPTTTEQVQEETRGFRLFGQRFTFDGYALQQLIYPAVGTDDHSRALPMGLDIPAVMGSNTAYALTDAAGATSFDKYTDHVAELRGEVNGISSSDWIQNLAGGWLYMLQPLAIRDAALVPPMMQTDAWKRKDLTTFMGSYTQLKHATLLYTEQADGGLGGGGFEPPVISYSVVEPNPLVFARISILSTLLLQGLEARGYHDSYDGIKLNSIWNGMTSLAVLSAQLAEMARKEVAGEPLTHDEAYFLQENFKQSYWVIRYYMEIWMTDPPKTTALIADIASNTASGEALELGIGAPDLIYVITNSPYGLQVTRGAVYSNYEFTVPIDKRMTDDEWRAQVAGTPAPERPDWIGLYFSQ